MTLELMQASLADAISKVNPTAGSAKLETGTRLVEDLGLDSLDLVSFLMEVQENLQVEFDLEQVGQLRTIGDLMNHIAEQARFAA